MCMALTRRLQILLDEEQYARVEREADRRGGSVASVIREAVDLLLPAERRMTREEAADVLLGAPPMPVDDWDLMVADLDQPPPDTP